MKLFEKRHTDSLKNPRFEQKTLLRTIPKSGESFYYREISQSLTILVDICLLMNCKNSIFQITNKYQNLHKIKKLTHTGSKL